MATGVAWEHAFARYRPRCGNWHPPTDLARLRGVWEQVYLEVDGIPNPSDDLTAQDALNVITGNSFSVRRATGEVVLEGVFDLDTTTSPKSVTWIDMIGPDAGKRLPASYVLDGDALTFIAADEGSPRPVHFRTESGMTMRRFARAVR